MWALQHEYWSLVLEPAACAYCPVLPTPGVQGAAPRSLAGAGAACRARYARHMPPPEAWQDDWSCLEHQARLSFSCATEHADIHSISALLLCSGAHKQRAGQ